MKNSGRTEEERLVREELERQRRKNQKKNSRKVYERNANESLKRTSSLKTSGSDKTKINDNKKQSNIKKQVDIKSQSESKKQNKPIFRTTAFFSLIFFGIVCYYVYMLIFDGVSIVNNSNNPRLKIYANTIVRGSIYTKDGDCIAYTQTDSDGKETREYPYDSLFAHVVGMNTVDRGKTGLEENCDYYLLTTNANPISKIISEFKEEKLLGNNVYTTLDKNLQQAAYDSLGDNKGAVIVMNSDTGEILAMVSKPDYNPNDIDSLWKQIDNSDDTDSVLFNRATYGLYTPGSIFKIFTANEYLKKNSIDDFSFYCDGSEEFANYVINCYNSTAHGQENLMDAFAYSCNGAFATIGSELNMDVMNKDLKKLLFNSDLPVDFGYSKSVFDVNSNSTMFDKTQSSIGQGTTLVTPLHMAMIVQAIYNDGIMMKPYLVSKVDGADGTNVTSFKPEKYGRMFSTERANELKKLMEAVTDYGTASNLGNLGYKVGGKTGTAQIDSENDVNSWFVGYASKDNKNITVSLVIENVQDGSAKAVNCVQTMLNSYYN